MAIAVHGFWSGSTHTDEQRRPPGLSTRANSAVALARSGKNMYPKRTETLSKVASSNVRSSALHTVVSMLEIPCARARRWATSSISAARSLSTTLPSGASRAMVKPGSPVPEATSRCCWSAAYVETLDHGGDRSQLVHDHRVPLLPAGG